MPTEQNEFLLKFRRKALFMVFLPAMCAGLVVGLIVYNVMLSNYTTNVKAGIVNLSSNAFRQGVSVENTAGIAQLTGTAKTLITARSYTHLVIMDPQGSVVFGATDKDDGVIIPPDRSDFEGAMKGRTVARIEEFNGERTVHVIAPLNSPEGATGAPPGVLSGHRPLDLFLEGAVETVALVVLAILAFAVVAYLLIWTFTRQAAREVARHGSVATALERRLGASLRDFERQSVGTLQALSAAVDAKDAYTSRHSLNVADYACAIAIQMGREDLVPILERAGLLHDIGKIGVPETILQKPSKLTPEEFEAVAEHSTLGANMITMVPFLEPVVPAVLHHHERWDGSGYPDKLKGEAIPLEARILATADAFDAMTTDRPYRGAMTIGAASAEMMACRGTQFDPDTVDAILEAFETGRLRVRGEVTSLKVG